MTVSLKQLLNDLQKTAQETVIDMSNTDPNDLPTLLKKFKELHEAKELLGAINEVIISLYTMFSYDKIPTAFQDSGFESIKIHGRNFILSGRMNCSINKENEMLAHKWLEENGLSALIKPNVNSKSLTSAINEYFEANAKFPPPELIKAHKQSYIQVRKA